MLTVLSSECSTEGAWDNFCRDRVHSSHLGFTSIRYMSILLLNCKNNIILFCTIIVSFWQSPMAGPPISTSSNSSLNQEMKAICFFEWINNNFHESTTKSGNLRLPELADVGVALVQIVHAHPRWCCRWIVLWLDIPEIIFIIALWLVKNDHWQILFEEKLSLTCCSLSLWPHMFQRWLKWDSYDRKIVPLVKNRWCYRCNEMTILFK